MSERWGAKIKIAELRAAAAGRVRARRAGAPSRRSLSSDLEGDLRELLATIQDPQLRELLDRFFAERLADLGALPRRAGGEGLPPGLPARAARAHASPSPRRSAPRPTSSPASTATSPSPARSSTTSARPVAYNDDPLAIDLTDAGRLQGEIPLGYYTVRREIEEIPGFDPGLAQAVLHIILSHHGSLEHGSPVVPATREAVLVHMIDNLGGRLGSFDRLERELPAGEAWSRFDRALSGSAFFGTRAAA